MFIVDARAYNNSELSTNCLSEHIYTVYLSWKLNIIYVRQSLGKKRQNTFNFKFSFVFISDNYCHDDAIHSF